MGFDHGPSGQGTMLGALPTLMRTEVTRNHIALSTVTAPAATALSTATLLRPLMLDGGVPKRGPGPAHCVRLGAVVSVHLRVLIRSH